MSIQNLERSSNGPVTSEEASPVGFEERMEARIDGLGNGFGSLLVVRLPDAPTIATTGADQVTEALKSAKSLLRGDDLLGRHGNTSLCIFLADADREIAEKVSVRLRNWMQSFQPRLAPPSSQRRATRPVI